MIWVMTYLFIPIHLISARMKWVVNICFRYKPIGMGINAQKPYWKREICQALLA